MNSSGFVWTERTAAVRDIEGVVKAISPSFPLAEFGASWCKEARFSAQTVKCSRILNPKCAFVHKKAIELSNFFRQQRFDSRWSKSSRLFSNENFIGGVHLNERFAPRMSFKICATMLQNLRQVAFHRYSCFFRFEFKSVVCLPSNGGSALGIRPIRTRANSLLNEDNLIKRL